MERSIRVLHICNDFCGSKVHSNLYQKLDKEGVEQTIFTYLKNRSICGRNQFAAMHTTFIYKDILKVWHKALYHLKIHSVYTELLKEVVPTEFDVVHATTLFSDGAIAYRLYEDFQIPYIVAVRSCDTGSFLKYAPHTWKMGIRILRNAKRIIFISPIIKEKLCRHFVIKRFLPDISNRFVVQPNGIDDYWLDNINLLPAVKNNVIYVGSFLKRKNVEKLISAILTLNNEFPELKLHIVGDSGNRKHKVMKLVRKYPNKLIYHGKIIDKNLLLTLYRQCAIFAMPSIRETFGLVYIEALTQNLRILYSIDDGIDGLLNSEVGVRVNPRSAKSVEEGLRRLLITFPQNNTRNLIDFSQFRWGKIAKRYGLIYEDAMK